MVAAQCIFAAMTLWVKAALTGGMSPMVFVVYRQAVATAVLVPVVVAANRSVRCISLLAVYQKEPILIIISAFPLIILIVVGRDRGSICRKKMKEMTTGLGVVGLALVFVASLVGYANTSAANASKI
jgi:hypothetical protein